MIAPSAVQTTPAYAAPAPIATNATKNDIALLLVRIALALDFLFHGSQIIIAKL